MSDFNRTFLDMFGDYRWRLGSSAMSPAGMMLARLDDADRRVQSEADITDELRCAMRRAEIKAMREVQP